MKFWSLIVCSVILFTACDESQLNTGGVLPGSSGMADEVIVVGDPSLWKGELEEAFRDEFYKPYPVMPQYEATIKLTFVPYKEFAMLFKRHRNIIFIADLSTNTEASDFVSNSLGEDYTAKALNDPNFFYAIKKNAWAKPQNLIFVFGNSKQELVEQINTNGSKLTNKILASDITNKYMAGVYFDDRSTDVENEIREKYGIELKIPDRFFVALNNDEMIWIRRETDEASYNLFVSSVSTDSTYKGGIAWRNELGKFVESGVDSAYMVSDTVLSFETRPIDIGGIGVRETRGLWRMKHDFMGGPFVNYVFEDRANEQMIMIDAWIYAPKTKKKPLVRYMETVVSTLKLTGASATQ